MLQRILKNNNLVPVAALAIMTMVICFPILHKMIYSLVFDYRIHFYAVKEMSWGNFDKMPPHFLFHIITAALYIALFNVSVQTAGLITTLLCSIFLALIMYYYFLKQTGIPLHITLFIIGSAMLLAPIPLLAPFDDGHCYLSYIATTAFHNPTIIVLKPFAMLSFYFAVAAIQPGSKTGGRRGIFLSSMITALALAAKPSYTICLLPAVTIAMLYLSLAKRQNTDWKLFVYGMIMPAVLILLMQYSFTYGELRLSRDIFREESKIIFAPFQAIGYYTSRWLGVKFLLSILFPLTVFIAYFKKAVNNRQLMLAWLTFLVGAFYFYFLAESGLRMHQGNFGWGAMCSAFILFFITAVFLVQQEYVGGKITSLFGNNRFTLCALIYCLHLGSGIIFYALQYFGPEEYCW